MEVIVLFLVAALTFKEYTLLNKWRSDQGVSILFGIFKIILALAVPALVVSLFNDYSFVEGVAIMLLVLLYANSVFAITVFSKGIRALKGIKS